MAVEVVGVNEDLYKKATCGNCASILRFVNADIMNEVHRDYTGDAETFYYINCPKCEHKAKAR